MKKKMRKKFERCETNVDENFKLATPFPQKTLKKPFPIIGQ
jgi:hypothetical protein